MKSKQQCVLLIIGAVAGIVGLTLLVYIGDWLHGTTTLWMTYRAERQVAKKLNIAMSTGTLQCTSGPVQVHGNLANVTFVVIPRIPLQNIIEIYPGADVSASILLHGLHLEGFTTPGIVIDDPPGWIDGGVRAAIAITNPERAIEVRDSHIVRTP